MNLVTYSDIKTKLLNDLDIADLDFINGETELLGYMNEAIDDAESLVHTLGLHAKYFLVNTTLTLVPGTSDYALPSDIFSDRIEKIFYINGTIKYEVFRVRDLNEIPFFQTGDDYKYILINTTTQPNGKRIRIYPTTQEAGSLVHIYYIRNAQTLTTSTASTNVSEIPESQNFIYQHCKCRIYEKMGNPMLQVALAEFQAQKALMIETLQEQVPDDNTLALGDFSFYEESWSDYLR